MTRKIFRSIVLVAGTVLLASLLLILGYLYDFFGGVQETQLKDELTLASAAVESTGGDYLAQLSSDRFRLTWIAADGSVLYDTQADAILYGEPRRPRGGAAGAQDRRGREHPLLRDAPAEDALLCPAAGRRDGVAHLRQPRDGGAADRSACCSRCCWCWPRH